MAKIIGYVFRVPTDSELVAFFECIGLSFLPEQHEGGPVHQVCKFDAGAVLELYPRTVRRVDDMLVIQVPSVKNVLARLRKRGYLNHQTPEISKNSDNARISSPDGRDIYLTQEKEEV